MNQPLSLFWFKKDLRLSDNPGFFEAAQKGPVMAVYIWDEETPGEFKSGEASRWWLHHSLEKLNHSLKGCLNLYQGKALDILRELVQRHALKEVYWNRSYEPWCVKEGGDLKKFLASRGMGGHSFNGSLLWEPWEVLKADGTPYKVYTPFYRRGCLGGALPRPPLPAPSPLSLFKDEKHALSLPDLGLLPSFPWYHKIEPYWAVGEKAAQKKLEVFLREGLEGYKEGRNYPALSHVSQLSPHLHFGEISPNQVWYGAQERSHSLSSLGKGDLDCFLSELGWREFSAYLLYHFPTLPRKNFQAKFEKFPWKKTSPFLQAWKEGRTGYPLVDAGMRELWQTGYLHNRLRMIVASFLVKNLGIHWHAGEDWFWDCLVDADLANNSMGWQWVAGSGVDAAPYFRIFNPTTQGEKFDPEGLYTKRFVPELSELPPSFLFRPWEAPEAVLKKAGVILGKTYPYPLVDLQASREEALAAYQQL